MKTAAFVPIKMNNQRLPGKNTKKFDDGTSLITHFLKMLVSVEEFNSIYVFCSNEEIREYLINGVNFCKRPERLDLQSATPQDIISEFMKCVEADVYAVCHCTSPFVSKQHISECLQSVLSGKHDSAFLGERIQRLLWKGEGAPINFDPGNIPRTQDLVPIYAEVSAAYVFKKETFTRYRRRIGNSPYMVEISGIEAIDIDNPEDFEIANAVYMSILKGQDKELYI